MASESRQTRMMLPAYGKVMDQYGKFTADIHMTAGSWQHMHRISHGVDSGCQQDGIWKSHGCNIRCERKMDPRDLFAPAFGDLIAEVPADKLDAS